MIFIILWILGLIAGFITTLIDNSMRDIVSISKNLLFYQLVITSAFTGLFGFLGHVLRSDKTAENIGWKTGSPFQKELGSAELGYGIAGLLCIWFKGYFWLALIVVITPLYLGAAAVHIKETVVKKNFKPDNAVSIIPDILNPATLIVLSITGGLWK